MKNGAHEKELILASASPRRHEILTLAGFAHRVLTAPADEHEIALVPGHEKEGVIALARLKNRALREQLSPHGAVVLSADTIVCAGGAQGVLGKPKDPADAARMLRLLSGREHTVLTGVSICDTESGEETAFAEETAVRFRELSDTEIARYVESGDPLDKAGAYGYQSGACVFVEGIRGDYFNVVGLPVCRVAVELAKFGILPR